MPLTRLDVLAGYPLLSSPAERVSLHPAPALVWGGRPFGSSDVLSSKANVRPSRSPSFRPAWRLLLQQPNRRLVCHVRARILVHRALKSDTTAGASTPTMADSAQDTRGLFIQSASRVSCFGRNVASSGRDGKLLHIHQSGANLCQANS